MDNTGITRIVAIILTVLGMVFTFQFMSVDSHAYEVGQFITIEGMGTRTLVGSGDLFIGPYTYVRVQGTSWDMHSSDYPFVFTQDNDKIQITNGGHGWKYTSIPLSGASGGAAWPSNNDITSITIYGASSYLGNFYATVPIELNWNGTAYIFDGVTTNNMLVDYESEIQFSVNASWGDIAVDWADSTGSVDAVKVELAHGPLFPLIFESYMNEAYSNPFVYDSSYEDYDVKHLYTIVVTAYVDNEVVKTQTFNNIRMGGYDLTRVFEDDFKFNLTYVDEGLKVTALQNCDVNYMIELVSKDRKVKVLGTRNFMNRTDSNIMSMLMGDSFLIPWTDLGAASNTLVDADFKISARSYQTADEMVLVYDGSIDKKFIITSDVNPITGNEYSQYFDMDDINSIDPSTFSLSDGYQTFKDLQSSSQETIVFMGGLHGLFSGLVIVQIALGVALARLGIVIVISLIKLFL